MSKKILFMSSAKLTAISFGLLLAVFCTIGMSFRPVYDENEAEEIVMSGPRRSHWTTSGTEGCDAVTYYNDKKDYAKTESVTLGNGYTTITANSKKATPVNSNATAANGKSYVEWNSGVDEHVPNDKNKTPTDETSLKLAHTNTITFKATPMDGYYFVGWYDNSSGTGKALSTDTLWTTDVAFATAAGITSYGTSQITTYENSLDPWTETFYAKFAVIPAIDVTFIAPSTASVNRGTYTVTSEGVTTTISTTDQVVGVKGTTLTASLTDKYEFVDWYKLSGSGVKTIISTDNPCTTSFTEEVSVGIDYKELTNNHLKFTYKAVEKDEDGSYTGSYTVDGITVQANDYIYNTGDSYHYSPTLTATPASGYAFGGWYTKSGKKKTYLSYDNPWNPTFIEEGETIYANFVFNNYTDDQKAQFKVGSTTYTDLNEANAAASSGSNKTIICVKDGILPPGSYTISAGNTLLVPYNDANTMITEESKFENMQSQTYVAPSAYRTLIFADGANVTVDGTLYVAGMHFSSTNVMKDASGGPGRPIGPVGRIHMADGGHIELNGKLYCFGFITGQDFTVGNNTIDVGTITANGGSLVYENFIMGDMRGGDATYAMTTSSNTGASGYKAFPFNSYFLQNIEIPISFKYGSSEKCVTSFNPSSTNATTTFTIIGGSSSDAMFRLNASDAVVKKWYDATTDHFCVQLSGNSSLENLKLSFTMKVSILSYDVEIDSKDYILPIPSSMHIVLDNSNVTLTNQMCLLPGSIVEIKDNASLTLSTNLHLYDVGEWDKYCLSEYFTVYNTPFTPRYIRSTSDMSQLDAAKFIIDGTCTVNNGYYLYSTASGANICGNGGGILTYKGSLPGTKNVYQVYGSATGTNTSSSYTLSGIKAKVYLTQINMNAANLCNEDGSYTQSIASRTFHNVYGRWFVATDKDPKDDHTYKFTYITSGAVSGSSGTTDWTPAVYSWDKTGVELQQKWANVTYSCEGKDENENTHYWWQGQGDQSTWFYNWTINSDWHQFMPTATEGMYSGSNNKIYTKTECVWGELGETDVNCLYTIGGIKKALVEGEFVALEPNNNDPAYHAAEDATQYYICFEGCNWHPATKYEGENKAYIVDGNTYIWYEEHWMAVEREEPFFYTTDETNVKVYYEYIGSDWSIAEPYIRLTDAFETRLLMRFSDAIAVASAKKNATITILRDFVNITSPMTYTASNTTCTLDLNGHTAEVQVTGDGTTAVNMLTLNGAGSTFTITDNTAEKKGELKLVTSFTTENNTKRWRGIYLQNGSLVMANGKLHVENPVPYTKSTKLGYIEAILVASGKTLTVNDGTIEAVSAYNPYGIEGASGTPTITINGGTIETVATTNDSPYAIYSYGTINIIGGTINAIAKASSSAMGIYVVGNGSTANISGGAILARATSSAQGVRCWGSATVTGDYNAETPDNTPKSRSYSIMNITGGTITAECTTSTTSYGVLSYGTTNISGGTITSTVQKSNQHTAYGVYTAGGTTTISAGANITANAPTKAYGVTVTGANGDSNRGWPHVGVVNITGGTITANTTNTTTAYGLLVTGATWTINKTNSYSVFNGDYASAGTATVSGGTFNANAKTTLSRGIAVAATQTKNAASATPKCTINGGYYKMMGTGDVLGCNASALAADFQINGGYYSHEGNLATYAVSPKQVLTLASGDANRPPYYYKVAEAYLVTFKSEDGTANIIDPVYQEVGTAPVCSTEPTKESTSTNSFTFDGWATEANGAKVYEPNGLPNVTSAGATYYAHFATTTLKYRVHFDAATNGGECATENIYVNPGTAVGELPTATKYGYTFNGWFTAGTGGTKLAATTVISANADYYAQFTANSHTLTWDLVGGTVSTAGKIGSTTWPAKNATGTQSQSVAYGTILTTIPVVTKTGYTFNRWDPVPTSSMPDEDVTYTALWNPNTNTKYTVKHYLQNVDGTYPTEPTETEALTGTTDESVTPEVKSYDGFVSPAKQTASIAADGSLVVEYQYARVIYEISLDATTNGGECAAAVATALHGATISSLPEAVKEEGKYAFIGWFTKAEGGTQITDASIIGYNMQKLYAQFSPTITNFTITWLNEDKSVLREDVVEFDAVPSYGSTPTKTATAQYTYTFNGWTPAVAAARVNATYIATFSSTLNKYAITFKNGDDELQSSEIDYGTTPSYAGTPTKPTSESYTYTFDGWSTEIDGDVVDPLPAVSAAATYYAHFAATANVASVTVGGATTYYTDFAEAWEATNSATGAVTLKLLQDVSGITTSLAYTNAQNYTLDLNNHMLSGTVSKLIDINATGKTFTIDDSSLEKEGKISMITSENARVYGLFITAGIVNLKHGTIYSQNTHVYSSAAANKNSAATGVYVTKSQTFIMDGGAVESEAQRASYAILADKAGTTTITINDGLIKGHTNKSANAAGIYTYAKGLTVNNGRIVGHAYTTTAYGILLYGGSATLNGGTIEATNDTTNSAGTTITYGVYVRYSSSSYKGVLTVPATSTVNVLAKSRTTTAYAIYVYASSTASTIAAGTFTAIAKTGSTARGICSDGNIAISGGTFNVSAATTTSTITTVSAGIYAARGTVTVTGNPTFNVTSGAARAFGAFAYGTIGAKGTGKYSGTININGGTFNVTSTTTTAYGAYAGLLSKAVSVKDPENPGDTIAGQHYMPGIISITDGTFNVKAKTTKAYGLVLSKEQNESGAVGTTLRSPKITVTGGKFKVESVGDANATACAISSSNNASQATIEGGWYSVNANLSRYVEPEKSCNYYALDLVGEDPYLYKVAEAYMVSFDTNGHGEAPETQLIEKGEKVAEPSELSEVGYTFAGWYKDQECTNAWNFTSDEVAATTTLYAKWTRNTYTVRWENYNEDELETDWNVAYGATPTYNGATPAHEEDPEFEYTFDGWTPEVSAVTEDITYTATYTSTKKKYTITWKDMALATPDHVIKTEEHEWHDTLSFNYQKPSDLSYSYVFLGWSPEVTLVEGDTTYVALYNAVPLNMIVEDDDTIPGNVEVVTTTVKVSGHLTINEGAQLTTNDLILEASGTGSGDINGADRVQLKAGGKAYFDYTFDVDPWHWSAFGVPFEIDLDAAAPLKETTTPMVLGSDYDIVYYDSDERAAHGPSSKCWKYVEYDAEHKLTPGVLYMIAFNRPVGRVNVVRFTKAAEAAIDFTANVALATDGTGNVNDNNWNGIANPRMYHALLHAGVTECQVHDGGEIGKDGYYTYDMQDRKFFVGKAAFVQVPNEQNVMTTTQATDHNAIVAKAPRRAKAQEGADRYDVQIAPMAEEMSDRVFLLTDEDKADEYVIVSDLAKAGVSPVRPQMWVNRYGVKLCKNTIAMRNNVADYPLGISVPADGSYDIFLEERPNNDDMLYLTYDGEAIWNLSYGACTIDLQRGTTDHYGLRVVARTPQVATGIEETTIQNGDAVRKVIVEDKVFIIRNGQIFGIDGRLAK